MFHWKYNSNVHIHLTGFTYYKNLEFNYYLFWDIWASVVSIRNISTGKLTVLANVLGILDFILNFPGYHRWRFTDVIRNILKIIVSLAWSIILPVCYLHQNKSFSFGKIRDMLSFLDKVKGIPPLYMIAVIIYLLPNILAAVLFIFPMLRRWIENSDWVIVRFLLWWSQVWLFPFPSLTKNYLLDLF